MPNLGTKLAKGLTGLDVTSCSSRQMLIEILIGFHQTVFIAKISFLLKLRLPCVNVMIITSNIGIQYFSDNS